MKNIELLAPAGDFECLKQAVWAKANAVYFGAKNFNARAKAENFDNMKEAVAFCHMYGVKAYLTLNTLIENDQIDELIKTIEYAISCGIDAFIVQDFGVLNILKNCFKNVEIHASTQMAINNFEGAMWAQKNGIKRVVLSRETNIEDIKLIKQNTNLEIEYFIQGALCVCFSGNCYLSSKLFGKSGNKGECLQPCRLPYKALLKGKVIKEGYLLSAKDICMANRLKELVDAGVDSFKIEGRLRRPGYVTGVTRAYRKIIDNNFNVSKEDIQDIKKCFNRGDFTEGYLNGNKNIIDYQIQGHRGIKIGYVESFVKGNKFNIINIKSNHTFNKGDGLKFVLNGKEIASMSAQDIKQKNNIVSITTKAVVQKDSEVYLILDSQKEQNDTNQKLLLPIDFKLIAFAGKKLELQYCFKDVKGSVFGDVCQKAENKPLLDGEAKEQLCRLGDTNFYLENFELITDNVFVRKQELNTIRRLAVEKIEQSFVNTTNVKADLNYINKVFDSKQESFISKTIEFAENTTSDADYLIIKPKDYLFFDYKSVNHKDAYLYIPSFLRQEDLIVIDNILKQNENLGVYAENVGALNYNRKTILGAKLNIKNIFACKELINKNIQAIVSSSEITDENYEILKEYFNIPIIKGSFDNFDLMTLVHCPIKMLFNNDCTNCKYCKDIIYKMENGINLKLNRYKVKNCYFTLNNI